jgi:hypothetical protein
MSKIYSIYCVDAWGTTGIYLIEALSMVDARELFHEEFPWLMITGIFEDDL